MLADQPISKGTSIAISSWIINRSPDLWGPEAEVFNPERWVDVVADDTGGYSKWRPNNCIGEDFARTELSCLVADVVSRFEWTLDKMDKYAIPAGNITIDPLLGLYLNMKIPSQ
ncbi:hypothetical protein VPNG_01515 [Cytospora leucostoma]|uniref:Cytochrome P450 n=1 Tax=Cytospora leucostoma TaxID=1230097 RepID=A0A423XJV0_9PEZI|nr:hypothetical protein VPNG_01515 [Cytospora leucostoma]